MTDVLRKAFSAISALRDIEYEASVRECVSRMPETISAGTLLVYHQAKPSGACLPAAASHK
jgi:hypothetical protein